MSILTSRGPGPRVQSRTNNDDGHHPAAEKRVLQMKDPARSSVSGREDSRPAARTAGVDGAPLDAAASSQSTEPP